MNLAFPVQTLFQGNQMDNEGKFLTEFQLINAEGWIDLENHHFVMDKGQSFSIHLKTRRCYLCWTQPKSFFFCPFTYQSHSSIFHLTHPPLKLSLALSSAQTSLISLSLSFPVALGLLPVVHILGALGDHFKILIPTLYPPCTPVQGFHKLSTTDTGGQTICCRDGPVNCRCLAASLASTL